MDALWLKRLQQEGIRAFLPQAPPPPGAFSVSLQQLNQGQYWEAHESLEALWVDTPYPLKLFYYALIKLAVGLLHLERRNQGAAIGQLGPAIQYLSPFTPAFLGIGTDTVLAQGQERLSILNDSAMAGAREMWHMLEGLPHFQFPVDSTAMKS